MLLYLDRITLLCYLTVNKFSSIDIVVKTLEDKIQTTIYLPKSVHTELRIKALKEHVSMTKLIIRAISRELKTSVENYEKGDN